MQNVTTWLTIKSLSLWARTLALPFCLFCAASPQPTLANNLFADEYAVKAAYIYNILRFIEWEDNHPLTKTESFNICLLKNNPFQHHITPIKEKTINNKLIKLKVINNLDQTTLCHLIFIDNHQNIDTTQLQNHFKNSDSILLGNNIDFINSGGLFGFYIENNRVKLGANVNAIVNTNLKISSLLIEVCQLYGTPQ